MEDVRCVEEEALFVRFRYASLDILELPLNVALAKELHVL